MKCPCQSSKKYSVCCGRYHLGTLYPPTAKALSRARYSAYVLDKPGYIYNTWVEDTRPSLESIRLLMPEPFIDFQITHTDMGEEHHDIGTVTFIATLQTDDVITAIKEVSLFKRIDGQWLYFRGDRS